MLTLALSIGRFQHSAARRRLENDFANVAFQAAFQHSAARRRLAINHEGTLTNTGVSTLSRPKAAGHKDTPYTYGYTVSTLSRPKAAGADINQPQ